MKTIRLKIPGAWSLENASNLARSQIAMKNDELEDYWKSQGHAKVA
ncbi:hypothetical protein MLD52_15440 [Puniceicoccaceae bacterium K14]|nr:hypothetical protein [Puniceicoccaceae bacterium K14]